LLYGTSGRERSSDAKEIVVRKLHTSIVTVKEQAMTSFAGKTDTASVSVASPEGVYYPGSSGQHTRQNSTRLPVKNVSPVEPYPRECESPRTAEFRKKWFPQSTASQWSNWRWQIAHRITSQNRLEELFELSTGERDAFKRSDRQFPFAVTPYYLSLCDPVDPSDPLRRTVIPVTAEYDRSAGESDDPLCEDAMSPVPGIIHRYPDRVLFLVTPWCSTFCRYCTRSRMVGNHAIDLKQYKKSITRALAYIRENTGIRDVLISGGDPLTLDNIRLEWILREVRSIPHVEIIRIGTKVPVVLPQRITSRLTSMLRKYHPLWMSIHFTHPREITPEAEDACGRLADAGIPLGSQTVLLSGVNDDSETLRELYHRLMRIRVKPYYLYQCDPITGSAHFRTPVVKGVEIISSLQGHTSGYAVPRYVIDAPGGGGKIPVEADRRRGRKNGRIELVNYEGKCFSYPDDIPETAE
jgi:lysine 2,3-aminomutase